MGTYALEMISNSGTTTTKMQEIFFYLWFVKRWWSLLNLEDRYITSTEMKDNDYLKLYIKIHKTEIFYNIEEKLFKILRN